MKIGKWRAKYQPPEEIVICDGTQWQVEYREEVKRCRHIYGDNAYPENWADFINAIKNFLKGYERRELFNQKYF